MRRMTTRLLALIASVAVLCTAVALAIAAQTPGDTVAAKTTGAAAKRAALAALKKDLGRSHDGVVFGLGRPLKAGTTVGDAAPVRSAGKRDRTTAAPLRLKRAAYLFWLDPSYPQDFDHSGRVVLVDAANGHVVRNANTKRWPLVNGADPPFINLRGPGDKRYRVATHFDAAHSAALNASTAQLTAQAERALGGSARARQAAATFSDDCVISMADDSGKSNQKEFNDFWGQNGALIYDESDIPMQDPDAKKEHPNHPNGDDVETLVKNLPARCKDVIIYVNGEGSETKGGDGITVGSYSGGADGPVEQVFSPANFKQILKFNPNRKFKLVVDGCHSGIFIPVAKQFPNAVVTLTATGTGFGAFTPKYGPMTYTKTLVRALKKALANSTPEDPADGVSLGARILSDATESTELGQMFRDYAREGLGFFFISGNGERWINLPDFKPAPPTSPTPPPPPPPPPAQVNPPVLSPISAEFDSTNRLTTYSILVNNVDGRPLTYTWSLVEHNDPPCVNFVPNSPEPNEAIWHHGDLAPDNCDHSKETPLGHDGTVTVVVDDGKFTCTATIDGTVTHNGPAPGPCTAK